MKKDNLLGYGTYSVSDNKVVEMENDPDDLLSLTAFVEKYQRDFALHFLPKYCVGVKHIGKIDDNIQVTARVRLVHSVNGSERMPHLLPYADVQAWRKNVKFYTFMKAGLVS